jgi:CheY-like chemotaxis protein
VPRPADVSRRRRPRVLVVEDEPDVGELLRFNLAREGYEVLPKGQNHPMKKGDIR